MATATSDLFRPATYADAEALTALERDTNLVALAHVFPGVPYPEAEVRARWAALLEDPRIRVEVTGPAERLVLSHRTVQNHVQNTLGKLQMHNRVELTRYAIERGIDGD